MRLFYLSWPAKRIYATPSRKLKRSLHKSSGISETLSRKSFFSDLAQVFPLPWSHYVRLLSVEDPNARVFYEEEAIRCGWSVRQLDRQIATQFFERMSLPRNKAKMIKRGEKPRPGEVVTAEHEIKDPYVLEFLGFKGEYSEGELEEALVHHLERFLLELGGDFASVSQLCKEALGQRRREAPGWTNPVCRDVFPRLPSHVLPSQLPPSPYPP